MFALSYTFSAFRQRKMSTVISKQLSTMRCSNIIALLCTVETEDTRPDEKAGSD